MKVIIIIKRPWLIDHIFCHQVRISKLAISFHATPNPPYKTNIIPSNLKSETREKIALSQACTDFAAGAIMVRIWLLYRKANGASGHLKAAPRPVYAAALCMPSQTLLRIDRHYSQIHDTVARLLCCSMKLLLT